MGPIWFLIAFVVWGVFIFGLIMMLFYRVHREKRSPKRPTYEFGNSIMDWETACRKSYEWSHSRRNNRKEVKS